MRINTAKGLQKKRKHTPELWMKDQLVDFSLRDGLPLSKLNKGTI